MRGRTTSRLLIAGALVASLQFPVGSAGAAAPPEAPEPAAAPTEQALPVENTDGLRTIYTPIAPNRLADTRSGFGFQRLDANTIRVQVAGRFGVPANARAAVLNVVMVNNRGNGFLTIYPAGTGRPLASNLNADRNNMVIANMATVQLGAGGAVDIYAQVPADIVLDVSGAYVPQATASAQGRLVTPAGGAIRVLDTRDTASPLPSLGIVTVDAGPAGVPANASAVVLNVTAVTSGIGFWSVVPNGGDPRATSTLNIDELWQTRPGQAIVLLTPGARTFQVFSQGGGHLVVDVAGWFTGAGDAPSTNGQFVPTAPTRVLDTRNGQTLAPWGGSTFQFGVGNGFGAEAVAVNITGTESWDEGFVTAYPAGQGRPLASNLNFTRPSQTVANHSISRIAVSGLALFTQKGAHLIADVAGWYVGTPSASPLPAPANPVYTPNPATRVIVPKIGVNIPVQTGSNLDVVADRGVAATFPSMINVATPGNMMLFAHRTSVGGPFRHLNLLNPGDEFQIIGSDGLSYKYRVTRIDITGPTYNQVFYQALFQGPITAQLVACDPIGSTRYRIVVTGRLVQVG